MTTLASAVAASSAGSGAPLVARASATASSAPLLINALRFAPGGTFKAPSATELASEDAMWDSATVRNAAAVDALLASLTDRATKGEDSPLNIDEL
jgi:hypothetical protein